MDPRGTSEVPPRGTGENKKITWHKPTPTYCLRAFTVGGICKWLKHADCKSVLIEFAGSNPAPTTIKVRVERALRFIARSACRMRAGFDEAKRRRGAQRAIAKRFRFSGTNPAPTTIKVRVERALRFIARSACRMRTKWSGRQGTGQNENNFPRQGVFLS